MDTNGLHPKKRKGVVLLLTSVIIFVLSLLVSTSFLVAYRYSSSFNRNLEDTRENILKNDEGETEA